MNVRCPTCRAAVVWEAAPYRPFCSERCKSIDLGRWLREDYRIPLEDEEPGSTPPAEAPNH